MKKSLLHEALRTALDKLDTHPEKRNFPHYSFVVQDNQIIEYGRNNKLTPARHFGYQARIKDAVFGPKTHAEWDAYRKARGLLKKDKTFEIINIRLSRRGEIRYSRPCACCYTILSDLGCENFYYSSPLGFLKLERERS